MQHTALLLLLCQIVPFLPNNVSNALCVEIQDDSGYILRTEKPIKRIIALYGAFNELILALGCGEYLVARTAADGNLPELAALPVIGTHIRPNIELILASQPDLILQMTGRQDALLQSATLRKLGLPVLNFQLNSFADMFHVVRQLGQLLKREKKAEELIQDWQKQLQSIAERHSGKPPVKVFYEIRYPNLLAAGQGSIVNEIISIAGGQNVVTIAKKVVRLNEEALLVANPDVYLIQQGPMNPNPVPLTSRPHYQTLKAVKEKKIFYVKEENFARPSPRAIESCKELEELLRF